MKKLIVIPALLVAIGGGAALAQTNLLGSAEGKLAITADEAKEAALKEVNGQIVEFEYDGDDRTPHYELDIVTDSEKVEMDVDAKSGAVKVTEREVRATSNGNGFDDNDDVIDVTQAKISQEQAIQIAQAKASGTVTKVELDEDDNRLVYEIEIQNGQTEYDFDIDAQTGAIVKFEEDLED